MAIPKYFEMYSLFLDCIKDKRIHRIKDIRNDISRALKLSEEDLTLMLPSGKQRLFDNRIGWCKTYLKKANLITSPSKGTVLITERGLNVLAREKSINEDILMQFPEFSDFKRGGFLKKERQDASTENIKEETPQETLERAYSELNEALADELLSQILEMDPYQFEEMLVALLIKMGYGKLQYSFGVTKKSRDEGIDGIVTSDKLGFDSIYIQAKKYKEGVIGRAEIQKFVGALAGQGAQKGIFITTSKFSKDAEKFVDKNFNYKIVLVDGKKLSELMIEYELGVSTEYVYKLKKVDTDYFS